MNITIAGHEFARHLSKNRYADGVLLINNPEDDYDTIQDIVSTAPHLLCLHFFDLKNESETHRSPIRSDIETALEWYAGIKDKVDDLVVTCTAGISRSAATAFVIACSDRSPDEAAAVWNPRVHYPNRLIVKLGAEILGKPEMLRVAEAFWAERARRRRLKGKPPKVND